MSDTRPLFALRIHDRASVVPFPDPDQHGDLVDDIAQHGIQVPLDILADGTILDGRTRYSIAKALGIEDAPVRVVETDDAVGYMIRMALRRRHLGTAQRKALAEALIKAEPQRSNLSVATEAGISDHTVRKVRTSLEGTGDVPRTDTRTDSRGRQQPATKPDRSAEPPEPWDDALADQGTVAAIAEGLREADMGATTSRRRTPDPIDVITPAQAARYPEVAASRLSADLADAIYSVRTARLDPKAWAERVPEMGPDDIASLRSKVAHVHRWADDWDALLTPRPLSVVGGTK